MSEAPVKAEGAPKEEGAAEHINLKVKGQDGTSVLFRIKKSTPLARLMRAYCERTSVRMDQVVFLFDGVRLNEQQTPNDLQMEDDDEIDALLHQYGGSF